MTEKTKIIAGMEIQEDVLKLRIEKEQLEQENNKLLDVINNQDVKIADLQKENAELRNNGFTVSAMTEQQLKIAIEKGEQLEKENAELKEESDFYHREKGEYKSAFLKEAVKINKINRELAKAKEIIKKIEKIFYSGEEALKRLSKISDILEQAEQFLEEGE